VDLPRPGSPAIIASLPNAKRFFHAQLINSGFSVFARIATIERSPDAVAAFPPVSGGAVSSFFVSELLVAVPLKLALRSRLSSATRARNSSSVTTYDLRRSFFVGSLGALLFFRAFARSLAAAALAAHSSCGVAGGGTVVLSMRRLKLLLQTTRKSN